MLLFASSVKLIAEIALLSFVGRWLLGLLAGTKRDGNLFYQLLSILCKPFTKLARWISPSVVLDRHVPLVAFLLMGFVWLFATLAKVEICLQVGVEQCR